MREKFKMLILRHPWNEYKGGKTENLSDLGNVS